MDYIEVNQNRKSVHYFDTEKELDDQTLRKIIEQAIKAPSGYNLQPWQFLVLRDPANKQKMRELAYDQKQVTEASAVVLILGLKEPSPEYIERVFADWPEKGYMPQEVADQTIETVKNSFAGMSEDEKRIWTTRSTNLAGMNLMLAAQNYGVDTGPMEGFDFDGVMEAFKIPAEYYPVMLVAMGYRLPKENETDRKMRFGFDEKVWLEEVPQS